MGLDMMLFSFRGMQAAALGWRSRAPPIVDALQLLGAVAGGDGPVTAGGELDGAGTSADPDTAGWLGPRIRNPATRTMMARPRIAMIAFLDMMLVSARALALGLMMLK
ncbi:hypothetical protein EPK99_00525 [Neorhizobium lilium]|uniref:Uncharacterized protein n=1 Tax=Neorhizobium lilium TaxID=2503024 RepID=A0A3S3RKW1_9HYPH|nr:hypothetical protein [Neorhizobium lilium]RWX80864.1 hypothetical protein EPK99_00525 [Neorhizobium lilium]